VPLFLCGCLNVQLKQKCEIRVFNSKNIKTDRLVYSAAARWIKYAKNCSINISVDVVFLPKEELQKLFGKNGDAWTKNNVIYARNDLESDQFMIIMVHEFGHILGLDHDSGSCENMMDAVVCTKKLSKADKQHFLEKINCKK
jgi:hypothetical protein